MRICTFWVDLRVRDSGTYGGGSSLQNVVGFVDLYGVFSVRECGDTCSYKNVAGISLLQ